MRLSEVAKAYKPLTDREWDANDISAFGVVHKAQRTIESTPNSMDVYQSRWYRKTPKHIGTLQTTPEGDVDRITWVKTRRGHRRKGLASFMLKEQEKRTGRKIVHSTDLTRSGKKFAESVSKSIPSEFAAQLAARSSKGRVVWHASKAPHKKIRRRGLKPNAPWGKAAAKAAKGSTYPYDLTRSKSVFTSTSPAEATRYAQPGSRLYAIDPDAVKIRGSFEEGEGVETVLGRVPRSAILHSQNVKPGTQRRF